MAVRRETASTRSPTPRAYSIAPRYTSSMGPPFGVARRESYGRGDAHWEYCPGVSGKFPI
jgi:hypothetical protein